MVPLTSRSLFKFLRFHVTTQVCCARLELPDESLLDGNFLHLSKCGLFLGLFLPRILEFDFDFILPL